MPSYAPSRTPVAQRSGARLSSRRAPAAVARSAVSPLASRASPAASGAVVLRGGGAQPRLRRGEAATTRAAVQLPSITLPSFVRERRGAAQQHARRIAARSRARTERAGAVVSQSIARYLSPSRAPPAQPVRLPQDGDHHGRLLRAGPHHRRGAGEERQVVCDSGACAGGCWPTPRRRGGGRARASHCHAWRPAQRDIRFHGPAASVTQPAKRLVTTGLIRAPSHLFHRRRAAT